MTARDPDAKTPTARPCISTQTRLGLGYTTPQEDTVIIPVPLLIFIGIVWSAYTHVTASIAGHQASFSLGLLIMIAVILTIIGVILWIARTIIRDTRPRRTWQPA